jgi:hypothetical protein
MKTKNLGNRLVLNKKTIVNLNNGQLGNVKGGILTLNTYVTVCTCIQTRCTCPTQIQTCTCETDEISQCVCPPVP